MNKLGLPLVVLALATAACAGTVAIPGSTTVPSSSASRLAAHPGGNAASDVSDSSRPNPAVHHGGASIVPAQLQPPASSAPSTTSGQDRCGTAIGSGSSHGPQAGTPGPRHLPQPMCPPA